MSGYFYSGKGGLLDGSINWTTGVIKAVLVKGYTPSYSSHVYVSDVTSAGGTLHDYAVVQDRSVYMQFAQGQYLASQAILSASPIDPGTNYSFLVYQSSASEGGADVADTAQRLIVYYDSGTSGFPINPIGAGVKLLFTAGIVMTVT